MDYDVKWQTVFPASVGNEVRPVDPIDNTADYQTNGFPQFMANDPVRYDLQNAFLKQLLSNDERLKEIINGVITDYVKKSGDTMTGQLVANAGIKGNLTGNSDSATKLVAVRKINGVGFDGSADITVADSTKLPLSGGTLTGQLVANGGVKGNLTGNADSATNANNSNAVGGASLPQLVRSDISQNMSEGISHRYPKNGGYMLVGGVRSDGGDASCVTTDGTNLVLDSRNAGDIYIGYYGGRNVNFCGGSNSIKSHIDTNGIFQGTASYANGAGNSNTVAGLAVSGGRNNVGNQVVRTDGSGYLQTGYINSSNGDEGNNSNPARVWGTNGTDSYLRTYLTSALNVHQSSYTENVANDNTYMRFHWAGQGGQPTWLWGGNDASNMYVYNPSNFSVNYANSAGNVNGYTADALKNRIGGRNTPVLTPLLDKSQGTEVNTNTGSGIQGQGGSDLHLTQSYQNFDKILICWANDNLDFFGQTLWEKWELDYAFGNTYRFSLHKSGDNPYWNIWSSVNLGTSIHLLSTPTLWRTQDQNSMIKEIYGLTY